MARAGVWWGVVIVTLAMGVALMTGVAVAALVDVNGSAGIVGLGITFAPGGATLAGPITLTFTSPTISSVGNTGDLVPLGGTALTPSPMVFHIGAGSIPTISEFDITGPATFGTFTPTSSIIVSQSASFLNIFFTGSFVPGTSVGTQAGGCNTGGNTCDTTPASLRWTFNQSGGSITGAGTFNSPPASVSGPATLTLLGLGLAGLGLARRKW
jgi:hypothetical protein